jgi:hypothetical protein
MGVRMAIAGRPGTSTSRVFPNDIFHIGKHLSTLIVICERQTFQPVTANWGRPLSVQTPNLEENILHHIGQVSVSSTRRIAAVSHMTVWRVLHRQLLYPYHLQRVQGLGPADFPAIETFCQWFVHQCALKPFLVSSVLFTDEAAFTRNGIINFYNNHVWAEENPHAVVQSRHQQQFSINVWTGIIGDVLVDPHVLPQRLTGNSYRHFLKNDLPTLLEDLPLAIRAHMWFMHDGAQPHSALQFENSWTCTLPDGQVEENLPRGPHARLI